MTGEGSSTAERSVLLRTDGGSSPTPSLHFYIAPITHQQARKHVECWHYSQRMPTGKNICFGVFHEAGLYAVIVYGIGVNPYQASSLGVSSVLEIKRMCRSEPREDYPLSRFIRLTLRKLNPIDAVVAFADPEQGHEGTVYKAAGFAHEGMTAAEWHLVGEDGVQRHRRYAYRMARRNGLTVSQARDTLKMTRRQSAPKHRWVLRLPAKRRGI